MQNFRLRTNAVAFNSRKTLYAGTSQGLLIGTEQKADYFEKEGQNIITTYIESRNDTVFVCTQKQGILLFYKDELIDEWNTNTGLISNRVKKIVPYQDGFVASTDKGVVIISKEGETASWIGKPEGLTTQNVSDIAVSGNFLYVSHSTAVQKFSLSGNRVGEINDHMSNSSEVKSCSFVNLELTG